jgi:hypothetical protein
VLWVQDALESEAVDEGDDLVGQLVEVGASWQLPVVLCRGEYPVEESSPFPVPLVLLGLQASAGRGVAPEREPDSPFQDSFLVEGQRLGENRAERIQAAALPGRREHPFPGCPVDLPQGCDQDLFLVGEVVRDPPGGAARLLGDPPHRGGLDSFGSHDGPGGVHELAAALRVVDDLGHRLSVAVLQNNCCASVRRRLTMQNMCCAYGLSALEDAAVGVFGFIGRDGRPVSCAVTPYLDGGQPVITSTLALAGKIGAVLRDERVALLAGGAEVRGRATVAIEDDGTWFDRAIRAQELRKYPPARFLLRLPGHRRLLWWYVGRAVVRLPADGVRPVAGSDRVTVTGIDHDGLVSVVPVTGDVQLDADQIAVPARLPDGPVCLLVHEESAGMSDLRQLRLEGELVSGRLSVQRRSGTLAATHRGPLAQLRDLAALGRAATANRTRIESWKTRLGPAIRGNPGATSAR